MAAQFVPEHTADAVYVRVTLTPLEFGTWTWYAVAPDAAFQV
jgi:hypothetical protein